MNITLARCDTCGAPVWSDYESGAEVHVGGFKDCGVEGELKPLVDIIFGKR